MIVRAVALKDATVTGTVCACSGPGVTNPGYAEAGTVKQLGALGPDGPMLYAGLQLLSCTAGGVKVLVQANSSSGFTALNTGTDLVAFTSRACRDSQWAYIPWNCASATSTHRQYWRAAFIQTCAQTNTWLSAVSVAS